MLLFSEWNCVGRRFGTVLRIMDEPKGVSFQSRPIVLCYLLRRRLKEVQQSTIMERCRRSVVTKGPEVFEGTSKLPLVVTAAKAIILHIAQRDREMVLLIE